MSLLPGYAPLINMELRIGSVKEMREAHGVLRTLRQHRRHVFDALFGLQLPRRGPSNLMAALEPLGLVHRDGHFWQSPFRISCLRQAFLVTDPFTLLQRDRVFPLSADESFLLAQRVIGCGASTVLDIGTGSGVQAIAAGLVGGGGIATDINPKALHYARFNVALNRLNDRTELRSGNLYDPVDGEVFDLIVSIPPVIPTPEHSTFFVHSDGGPLGTAVSLPLLVGAAKHLGRKGRLLMLCTSFVLKGGGLAILDALREAGEALPLRLDLLRLYTPSLQPLTLLTNRFPDGDQTAMSDTLLDRGYVALDYCLIVGERAPRFSATVHAGLSPLQGDQTSGSWRARLARLFSAYPHSSTIGAIDTNRSDSEEQSLANQLLT